MSHGPLSGLAQIVDARSLRISSYDRTGGNADHIKVPVGETVTLAEMEGAGIVKHIWITISSKDELHRRNLVLRMYWDGQEHPSVESPIGDFFGQGWAQSYRFTSLPLACAPRNGNAMVCYFPMPFATGARITVENQGTEDAGAFYYYVDYEKHDSIPDDLGRFHAWYNQELTGPESEFGDRENEWGVLGPSPKNPTDANNYLFCEAEGRGHFAGVNYYVNCPSPIWYGEGDDMFLVDGEPWPGSAHGTGTEDYFNQSWSPDEHYEHPYFGTARAPGRHNTDPLFGWMGKTHCYRFHVEDPIRFTKSLRASIEAGHANVLTLDIASVAYWYQTLPSKPFPRSLLLKIGSRGRTSGWLTFTAGAMPGVRREAEGSSGGTRTTRAHFALRRASSALREVAMEAARYFGVLRCLSAVRFKSTADSSFFQKPPKLTDLHRKELRCKLSQARRLAAMPRTNRTS